MSNNKPIRRVAIIGTGVIGASWSAQFLAKGLDVIATDIAPDAETSLRRFVKAAWPALERLGLAPGASQSRLTFTADLPTAVRAADLVQENGPERIDFEQKLYRQLDELLPADVIIGCQNVVWRDLSSRGIERCNRSTWTQPVVRLSTPDAGPFVAAGTAPELWEAYDQLLGDGTWSKRQGVGGTIPVRFPSEANPGDAGWHIDGSFDGPDGSYWVNARSKMRGLLVLSLPIVWTALAMTMASPRIASPAPTSVWATLLIISSVVSNGLRTRRAVTPQ